MSKITLNGVDYMGGGGSGGHTIIDQSGNAMPSRTGLQFIGASVTDDSVNNKTVVTVTGGGGSVHYSTSEQVIGTWIDGKPLYEKTINYGALPSTPNIERDVNHGIPDVDTIWIADGFATNGTFVNQLNLSGVNNAEWFFGVTATYIRCMAQSDRSNYSAYVILRYTKTTD